MKATISFQDLARAIVRLGHHPFKPLGLFFWVDDAYGQPGIVHDRRDRVVANLGLLILGHLAVVAGGFGSLAARRECVSHRLRQSRERNAVLVVLDRCGGVTQHVARDVDWNAGPVNQLVPSRTNRIRPFAIDSRK